MNKDENMDIYIKSMNKIIRSGNPKYLSYVCKEYSNSKRNNPVLASIIESMILKEATDKGSCYGVLMDNDKSLNLEALDDISKIQNVPEFIKKVDALSEQEVDFTELTSDDVIIEGMEIAEKLAKEVESVESTIDTDDVENIDESQIDNIENEVDSKADNLLGNVVVGASVLTILKQTISILKNSLKKSISRIKDKFKNKKNEKLNEVENEKNNSQENGNANFITKVDVDEEKAIASMKKNKDLKAKVKENAKSKVDDFNSSSCNDTSDDDFDDNDDDDNNDDNDAKDEDELDY